MASIVPEELVAFAGRLADAAGAEIRPHFRVPSAVASKAGSSFRDVVTLVRRARPAMGSDGARGGSSLLLIYACRASDAVVGWAGVA